MLRFESLLVVLAFVVVSMKGCNGKGLPVPMSDIAQRLADLENRLLVQEKKNVNLEKRLLEQEKMNKVQDEIIKKMSSCDCKPKEKAAKYFGVSRYLFV